MVKITYEDFQKEGIPASAYHFALVKAFGSDIYGWEPQTLWLEIEDEFGVEPSEEVKDKIQAIIAVNAIDSVFSDAATFRSIALALNGEDPEFEAAGGLEVHEIAWALEEIKRNVNYKGKFGEEVKRFIQVALEEENFLTVPEEISKYVKLPRYSLEVDPEILKIPEVQKEAKIRHLRVSAYVLSQRELIEKYLVV